MICYLAIRSIRLQGSYTCNFWGLVKHKQGVRWSSARWSSASSTASESSFPTTPIFKRALQYHDRVALVDQHGEHTFGQIHKLSGHLANLLQNVLGKDIGQQRVAFLGANDVSYIITQWATWMVGHVAVPLHPKHPTNMLEYFVRDSESSVIVTTLELSQNIKPLLSGQQVIILEDFFFKPSTADNTPAINTDSSNVDEGDSSAIDTGKDGEPVIVDNTNEHLTSKEPDLRVAEVDIANYGLDDSFYFSNDALIIYTSGTTGPPKGVVLTHRNLLSQMSCLHKAWGWTSGDTILHCLPLHHIHGVVNALMCPLYVGARIVMAPQFNAATVWNHLLSLDVPLQSRVTVFMAVPTIYAKLIEEYETKIVKNDRMREYVKAVCMQNIRLMVSGSAALPEIVLERWKDITGHTLLERYGMTEIGMALSNPLKGLRIPGFVGNPLSNMEVRIGKFEPGNEEYDILCQGNSQGTQIFIDNENEVVGELLVRGTNVFKEYWKKPQATAKEFTHDKWFRTGDTAQYINGAYKILGRTSVDIIKSGGFKISALDVERHLITHSNILDVAVVGISDITWGQKVAAIIHWSGPEECDTVELKAWGRERMPHYQVPSVFVATTKELPRNNMGKVNKKQLIKDFFSDSDKK